MGLPRAALIVVAAAAAPQEPLTAQPCALSPMWGRGVAASLAAAAPQARAPTKAGKPVAPDHPRRRRGRGVAAAPRAPRLRSFEEAVHGLHTPFHTRLGAGSEDPLRTTKEKKKEKRG